MRLNTDVGSGGACPVVAEEVYTREGYPWRECRLLLTPNEESEAGPKQHLADVAEFGTSS